MPNNNGPFIPRKKKKVMSFDVKSMLGKIAVKGQVGLEIEVEGTKLPKDELKLRPYWIYTHDGSLRGDDNAEYVLKRPINFDDVEKSLDHLWQLFDKYGSTFDDSNRTSIHVHLNCQDFYLNRLASFAALYFCFEEVLTEWCGDKRVGNLFCLRVKDAPGILTKFRRFLETEGQAELTNGLHYSGFNVGALRKFGSIEIRTMRGVGDRNLILTWVKILERLYKLSEEFSDPRDIPALFSSEGPSYFFDTILGEYSPIIKDGISMNEDQIRDSMYEGIRYAQDICYCRDWSELKEVNTDDDPFNRSRSKLLKSYMAMDIESYPTATGDFVSYSTNTDEVNELIESLTIGEESETW